MATDRSDRLMTGMFRDRESAERAYECVTSRGYTDKDVSLLMSDDTRTRCFPRDTVTKTELGTKAAEGAGIGAATGAGLGALLIGLAATGVAIPLGPIIAMGPLAAALAGGTAGGAVGALVVRTVMASAVVPAGHISIGWAAREAASSVWISSAVGVWPSSPSAPSAPAGPAGPAGIGLAVK